MSKKINRVGILTFHNSYNCGSMMQTYALQKYLEKLGIQCDVIDFSNEGQRELYGVFFRNGGVKNFIKNFVLFFHAKKIKKNYQSYEKFKKDKFLLSKSNYRNGNELKDEGYGAVVAGSDQIWNITIADSDDAYFLPWVKTAKRIAYAPSFGAKNILKYSKSPNKYKEYLQCFECLSIREDNGCAWLEQLIGKKVPVVLDPTLLLGQEDYEEMVDEKIEVPKQYIFYYSPGYSRDINNLVKKISKKYKLPVVAFNAKSYYLNAMNFSSFQLPEYENPSVYLRLIKNATLVITTSFHGTVFSSIFKKNFWTVKNGGMFGDDDRVLSLMKRLDLQDRLIAIQFDANFDYMCSKNYENYNRNLKQEQEYSTDYIMNALELKDEQGK